MNTEQTRVPITNHVKQVSHCVILTLHHDIIAELSTHELIAALLEGSLYKP